MFYKSAFSTTSPKNSGDGLVQVSNIDKVRKLQIINNNT